jgi:uncharacterized protein DUF4440
MSMPILVPVALLAVAPGQASGTHATEREANEIVNRAQRLFDALAPGDVALWRDALTEGAVLIDEFGRRHTKAEALREMRPLPAGFSGSIEVRHPNVQLYPATAVLDCEMFEQEKVFDQQLTVRYLATLVFVRQGRDWKLAAMETVTLPTPPPRLEVGDLPLSDYPGTYTYGPGRNFIVEVNGRELRFRTRSDGRTTMLEPLAKDVFMDAGEERNLFLFRRDARGRVTSLIERRKFNDLHMRRVENEK